MSYAKLIAEALNNSTNGELSLLDIYKAISSKYPYFKSTRLPKSSTKLKKKVYYKTANKMIA